MRNRAGSWPRKPTRPRHPADTPHDRGRRSPTVAGFSRAELRCKAHPPRPCDASGRRCCDRCAGRLANPSNGNTPSGNANHHTDGHSGMSALSFSMAKNRSAPPFERWRRRQSDNAVVTAVPTVAAWSPSHTPNKYKGTDKIRSFGTSAQRVRNRLP